MLIALDRLVAHPLNANVMADDVLAKLIAHIRATGRYPPIIVRRLPGEAGRYQILDGHHRAIVLTRLQHEQAHCEVWDVDDAQAIMLLATLNRLHGEDDPHRRAALLTSLSREFEAQQLHDLLPEDAEQLDALLKLANQSPPMPADERDLPDVPRALTFFLDHAVHTRVLARLHQVHADRETALVMALGVAGGVAVGAGVGAGEPASKDTSPPETGGDA